MHAARTSPARVVDFSASNFRGDGAAALRREIEAFVRGVRGPRAEPVSRVQIERWFRATPAEFVCLQITDLIVEGRLRLVRRSLTGHGRANGAYRYVAVDACEPA